MKWLKRDSISKLMQEEIENWDRAIRAKYMKMIEDPPQNPQAHAV